MRLCCKRASLTGMAGKSVTGILEKRGPGEGDGRSKGGNLKLRKGFCGDCRCGMTPSPYFRTVLYYSCLENHNIRMCHPLQLSSLNLLLMN